MGGMLAVRLARAYGSRIDHLVLYSPIGLEDYRFTAPPVTDEELAERERALTADAYRKQLMTNYALSLPSTAIEPFVQLREQIRESGEYPRWLKSFVASYQMIYTQPVAHEIPLIDRPTLFIMGGATITMRRGAPMRRRNCARRWARTRPSRNRWRRACRMRKS